MSAKKNCDCGPGYASPLDAYNNGKREELIYVTAVSLNPTKPDYLATIDVNPDSSTYSTIIHRCFMTHLGDEIHHTGWNACSSCHGDKSVKRDKLILPCLISDRIYIVDTSNPREPSLHTEISPEELYKLDVSAPHTSHCLVNKLIMISTMGDKNGEAKGSFLLLKEHESKFKISQLWGNQTVDFGYDFWYQPRHNVMVSTEYGAPRAFLKCFDLKDLENGDYGHSLHVWDWKSGENLYDIDLKEKGGVIPLEIRFLHNPNSKTGFVGCALSSTIHRIYYDETLEKWTSDKVISVPSKKVENWILPEMPGLITDILISMDDKFLYFSNWIHGDVRQYDISDPEHPKLTGQIWLGGSIQKDRPVKVIEDQELKEQIDPVFVKGRRLEGGPQMLQLSLDGKRLYVTPSLLTPWDKQFYPDMMKYGGHMVVVDVDVEKGGMILNENFLVDFGNDPEYLAVCHEARYPGGDCSSDIWL